MERANKNNFWGKFMPFNHTTLEKKLDQLTYNNSCTKYEKAEKINYYSDELQDKIGRSRHELQNNIEN